MNFFAVMILMAAAFILQIAIGRYQVKDFSKVYSRLRARGRVAIGRSAGYFRAGAIVMFAIDDRGYVLEGARLQGVTAMARFKYLSGFEGKHIESLNEYAPKNNRILKKAIADAVSNYVIIVVNGGEVPEKPSPFKRAELSVKGLLGKKQAADTQ